jgi:CelD/BcsL family acetyltransferase involved in cellulose biosynthesis
MKWNLLPISEFKNHINEWQVLNRTMGDSLLLDPKFIIPLLHAFGSGREIFGIYRFADGNPQAMTILSKSRTGCWETFQTSWGPLSAWVSNPSLPLHEALLRLLYQLPGMALLVSVTNQDPQMIARPENVGILNAVDFSLTAKISLQGTFEEYWASRGKNLRHNLKRQRNKLESDGIVLRLETATSRNEIAPALEQFGRLENAGWKGVRGSAILPGTPQSLFYSEALEKFSDSGEALIFRYWYGNQLAAMDLCVQKNNVLIILKTAYDEAHKTSSPGLLMHQDILRKLFEEGNIKTLEFYGRLMDWHTKWTDDIRTLYHINLYRWPFLLAAHEFLRSRSNKTAKLDLYVRPKYEAKLPDK